MRRVLAAALLVALAGCSSAVVGTESPTVTPVPVTGEGTPVGGEATTPVERIVPGLTEEGVADPLALAGAHRSALADRSYTTVRSRTVRNENGTLRTVQRTITVGPNRSTYRLVQTARTESSYPVQSAADRVEIWVDDAGAVYRVGTDDPHYRHHTSGPAADPVTDITYHDRLVSVYSGLNWQVTAEDGDASGTAYVVLRVDRATDAAALAVPQLLTDPRNVTARAVVTGDGRLRQYLLAYDATLGDERVRVVRTLRFARVGATSVERPNWYAEAVNPTATPTPSADSTATDTG